MSDDGDRPTLRLEASIHGRVQGVGFRYHVRRAAAALALSGWVANRPDGSVAVVAEGPPDALDRFTDELERGPTGARVERVEMRRGPAAGDLDGFAVRAGSHGGD